MIMICNNTDKNKGSIVRKRCPLFSSHNGGNSSSTSRVGGSNGGGRKSLTPGMIIPFRTWHYGIDAGDGRVIHFCDSGMVQCDVKKSQYDDDKDDWEVVQKPSSDHQAETIVRVAYVYVGAKFPFDFMEQNCEHFANFCFHAKEQSHQAFGVKSVAGTVGVVGAVNAAAWGVAAATPTATLFGSATLGSWAINLGLVAAPTAPMWVTALAVGGVVGVGAGVIHWIAQKPQSFRGRRNIHEEEKESSSSSSILSDIDDDDIHEQPKEDDDVDDDNVFDDDCCVVCFERSKNVRFRPCDHLIVCEKCSNNLPTNKCPQCRGVIQERILLFE